MYQETDELACRGEALGIARSVSPIRTSNRQGVDEPVEEEATGASIVSSLVGQTFHLYGCIARRRHPADATASPATLRFHNSMLASIGVQSRAVRALRG